MAKELYLYSGIYSYTAKTANEQLSLVADTEELIVRFNTPGGETNAGFAFLSKLSERKTSKTAIIDGQAKSMGAYMLPFFNKVIANDTSEIMFHKAAYSSWYEPTEAEQASLKRTNALFEQKMRAKVEGKPGAEEFLSKLFEPDVRNDVELTPVEAKTLGIVDEVKTLEVAAYSGMQLVALAEDGEFVTEKTKKAKAPKSGDSNNQNHKSMDLGKLKSEHPALYAQVLAEGESNGIAKEKDRVGAWMVFVAIDAVAVAEGIKSGEGLSQTAMAEFSNKGIAMARVEDHKGDNPGGTKTNSDGKTAEQVKKDAEDAEMQVALEKQGLIKKS